VEFYLEFGRPPCALFVDYGQPAAAEEITAARAVSDYYGVPLVTTTWRGDQRKTAGLIPGRNLFLLAVAVMERPVAASVIAIGIHAGTTYADCSEQFVQQSSAAIHASGERKLHIAAPFLSWTKSSIYDFVHAKRVPVHLTYSCEAGGKPCGVCLSCQDRAAFDARS